jgi:DeoR/GlpR family transcriptional regulator of sugar metabolism
VASLIADGETVPLDSCTTCLEVARLPRGRQVTVMPLSLRAINVLSDTPKPASGVVALLGEWPSDGVSGRGGLAVRMCVQTVMGRPAARVIRSQMAKRMVIPAR